MANLSLKSISKTFGKVQVLNDISLDVADGEFLVFVGPSGCGKSTLLRIIAGLEEQSAGDVEIGEQDVSHLAPAHREIAMVFQTYALYPHLSVKNNMSLGLKQAKTPADEIEARVKEATRVLSMEDLLGRKPSELSGGQRQRVAIGRAIVRKPKVFLFDEPLSNLDASLRTQVRYEIGKLHKDLGATMVYVTHDQVEAMTLADKICVLHDGKIQQVGTPQSLYEDPDNLFVAGFIGSPKMNFISANLGMDGKAHFTNISGTVGTSLNPDVETPVKLGFRPNSLEIQAEDTPDAVFTGKIELSEYLGDELLHHIGLENGDKILVRSETSSSWAPDENVGLKLKKQPFVFSEKTGMAMRA